MKMAEILMIVYPPFPANDDEQRESHSAKAKIKRPIHCLVPPKGISWMGQSIKVNSGN